MIIEPWKAPRIEKDRKRVRKHSRALICPFCQKSHRTVSSAHYCALEVSKYGSVELRAQFRQYESEFWERQKSLTESKNIVDMASIL